MTTKLSKRYPIRFDDELALSCANQCQADNKKVQRLIEEALVCRSYLRRRKSTPAFLEILAKERLLLLQAFNKSGANNA